MSHKSTSDCCPLCATQPLISHTQYDTWLQCDACSTWYHAQCLKCQDVDNIEKFYCAQCTPDYGPTTYKQEQRKSKRTQTRLNYADLNEGKSAGDEKIWSKLLQAKTFRKDCFRRYKSSQVTIDLLRETGMREPFIIEENEKSLGMKMPPNTITVHEIATLVGENRPIEVIDVSSQSELSNWDMGLWAEYFHNPIKDRIRNVISLEISDTPLAQQITRPRIVRDIDWVDQMWPNKSSPTEYPKVQLYCLMGTKDSYTDFHIDFGGSSVFYHILSGSKTFYFIEPTSKNLKKYQKWTSSPDQSVTFFGDEVKDCYCVQLKAGNTMIIPTGWIHAVYTPEDSIVFGGNFLHSFNVATQLRVYEIEGATDVPTKFRFPFFKRLNWYALDKYNKWLQEGKDRYSYYEIESIALLAQYFQQELLEDIANTSGDQIDQTIRKKHQIPPLIEDPMQLTQSVLYYAKQTLLLSNIKLPDRSSGRHRKRKNPDYKDRAITNYQ